MMVGSLGYIDSVKTSETAMKDQVFLEKLSLRSYSAYCALSFS
jgi:hypothetical protein